MAALYDVDVFQVHAGEMIKTHLKKVAKGLGEASGTFAALMAVSMEDLVGGESILHTTPSCPGGLVRRRCYGAGGDGCSCTMHKKSSADE